MADLKSRSEYARTLFAVGALSPNDIRRMSGYNPIEGGDKHYVQVNMADINDDSPDGQDSPDGNADDNNVQTMLNGTE